MEARLLVIKKVLDSLEIPTSIAQVSDRIRLQKAIYLAQRVGVELGYVYGWYRRGPYSPKLTQDYFQLQDALALDDPQSLTGELVEEAVTRLRTLEPLMKVPEGVDLKDHLWLELVASVDYLNHISKVSPEEADRILSTEKSRLVQYAGIARTKLKDAGIFT